MIGETIARALGGPHRAAAFGQLTVYAVIALMLLCAMWCHLWSRIRAEFAPYIDDTRSRAASPPESTWIDSWVESSIEFGDGAVIVNVESTDVGDVRVVYICRDDPIPHTTDGGH